MDRNCLYTGKQFALHGTSAARVAGFIGLAIILGACTQNQEHHAPEEAHRKVEETTPRMVQVVIRPVQSFIETAGEVRVGEKPKEIILVAKVYELQGRDRLRAGREVAFEADPFPRTRFRGAIITARELPEEEGAPLVVSMRVFEQNVVWKPESFVRIRIVMEEKLLPVIPKTALLLKEGRFYVYRAVRGHPELHEVQPTFDFNYSEGGIAVEGLKEGEEILLSAMDEQES